MGIINSLMGNLLGTSSVDNLGESKKLSGVMNELLSPGGLNPNVNDLTLDDPFRVKHLHYPEEVGAMGDGHYIQFDIYENVSSKITDGKSLTGEMTIGGPGPELYRAINEVGRKIGISDKNLLTVSKVVEKEQANLAGISVDKEAINKLISTQASAADIKKNAENFSNMPTDKFSDSHDKETNKSIILYASPTTKFSYSVDYDNNAATGIIGGLFGEGNFLGELGLEAGTAAIAKLVTTAMEMAIPGFAGLITRRFGMATNPHIELAFTSVPFRDFTLPYTFAPKNKKELEAVHGIIKAFKFHMLPALTNKQMFFITPSQFRLTYMYRQGNNDYIPKIAKCVLKSMEVDYSPGEKFTTLKPDNIGASPQIINVNLQFTEMQIITKESVLAGC